MSRIFCASSQPAAEAGKLGLLLFQLPPNFKANLPLLRDFLSLHRAACRRRAAHRVRVPPRSWFTEEAATSLREHNAALCIAETEDFRSPELHTAVGHTSFRLRQSAEATTPKQIAAFAERMVALHSDRDVYVYFKHEDEPTGALNAAAFLAGAQARRSEDEPFDAEAVSAAPLAFKRPPADHLRQLSAAS